MHVYCWMWSLVWPIHRKERKLPSAGAYQFAAIGRYRLSKTSSTPATMSKQQATLSKQRSTLSKQHSTLLLQTATMSNDSIVKFRSFRQSRNKLNMFNLFRHCRKDEISFDIVAENGDNVEAIFDIVERIVQLVAFDNVALTSLLVWTELKARWWLRIYCLLTGVALHQCRHFYAGVRPSVSLSVPSAYSVWLIRGQHATRPACISARQ